MDTTSKGLDFTAYVSSPGLEVELEIDGTVVNRVGFQQSGNSGLGTMVRSAHEVGAILLMANQRIFLRARKNGTVVFERNWAISPLSGSASSAWEGNSQDMLSLNTQRSEISGDFAVNTGFFDAPGGLISELTASGGHITNRDQVHIYLTDSYEYWLEGLLGAHSSLASMPLKRLVVAGSHNAGNFTRLFDDVPDGVPHSEFGMAGARALSRFLASKGQQEIAAASGAFNMLLQQVGDAQVSLIQDLFMKMGNTQKDDITTQLRLGVRHFDFRPGYNETNLRMDKLLRQQHGFIQGYRFLSFLNDVVGFLKTHKQEIVTVTRSTNGFIQNDGMEPSNDLVDRMVNDALAGSGIALGGEKDLDTPIGDLLRQNRRLLFIGNARDSYADANKTTDMGDILKQCNRTLTDEANEAAVSGRSLVLQLQATATETLAGQIQSARATRTIGSPLLMTKELGDYPLYTWLTGDAHVSKRAKSYTVLMNDFTDNALVSHAIGLTVRRINGE